MKKSTAKTLRTLILVGWTIIAVVLLLVIQKVGDNIELQETIFLVTVVYVLSSAVLFGIVFHLTKIIKSSKASKRK